MGNIIDSLLSGFTKAIADFISGETCSSVSGSAWDLICYIDNFCVANLVKMAAILFLLYLALVLFYLIYKVGVCGCVCKGVCRMVWSCIGSSFSACRNGCVLICNKMRNVKRAGEKRRRSHNIEDYFYSISGDNKSEDTTRRLYIPSSGDFETSFSRRSGDRRKIHLEMSLRPRNHRVIIRMDRKKPRVNHSHDDRALHNVKVTHTSRFVHKGVGRRVDYRRC